MKNIFFLYYRSGSVLFEALCGKKWRELGVLGQVQESIKAYREWDLAGRVLFLPTIPPQTCPAEDISVSLQDARQRFSSLETWSYMVHVGDWWGQLPGSQIQGPYDYPSPNKWGWDDLLPLGSSWKFSALIRDGRNQIESLRRMKGGIEEQLNRQDPEDYFIALCKGFRNRARMIIDNQKFLGDRYKIFYFKDLISNPLETMQNIFDWHGLVLDQQLTAERIQRLSRINSHSSFGEIDGVNQRWHSWTTREKEIFDHIAGLELKELGYV